MEEEDKPVLVRLEEELPSAGEIDADVRRAGAPSEGGAGVLQNARLFGRATKNCVAHTCIVFVSSGVDHYPLQLSCCAHWWPS